MIQMQTHQRDFLLLFVILLGVLTTAFMLPAKRKFLADKAHSTVTYTMKHPMHTWDGVSRDVNGALIYNDETKQIENVAIVLKVASFDTKNANRDSHAIEVLDAIKYPTVSFVSQNVKLNPDGTLAAVGTLTFHGVTRSLTVLLTRQETADTLQVDGNFPIRLTDYKIAKPSLMMVPVDDVMTMNVHLTFKGIAQ